MEYYDSNDVRDRAYREFGEYVSREIIDAVFRLCGSSSLSSLNNVRYMLVNECGVEGIPFVTYRKDNDPMEVER